MMMTVGTGAGRSDFMISDAALPIRLEELEKQDAMFAQLLSDFDKEAGMFDDGEAENAVLSAVIKRPETGTASDNAAAEKTDAKAEMTVTELTPAQKKALEILKDAKALAKEIARGRVDIKDLPKDLVTPDLLMWLAYYQRFKPENEEDTEEDDEMVEALSEVIAMMNGGTQRSVTSVGIETEEVIKISETVQPVIKSFKEEFSPIAEQLASGGKNRNTQEEQAIAEYQPAQTEEGFTQTVTVDTEAVTAQSVYVAEEVPEQPVKAAEEGEQAPVKAEFPEASAQTTSAQTAPEIRRPANAPTEQTVTVADTAQPTAEQPAQSAYDEQAAVVDTAQTAPTARQEASTEGVISAEVRQTAEAVTADNAQTTARQTTEIAQQIPADMPQETAETAPAEAADTGILKAREVETVVAYDTLTDEPTAQSPAAAQTQDVITHPAEATANNAESMIISEAEQTTPTDKAQSEQPQTTAQPVQQVSADSAEIPVAAAQNQPEAQSDTEQSAGDSTELSAEGTNAPAKTETAEQKPFEAEIAQLSSYTSRTDKAEQSEPETQTERYSFRQVRSERVKSASEELEMLKSSKVFIKAPESEDTAKAMPTHPAEPLKADAPIIIEREDGTTVEVRPGEILSQAAKLVETALKTEDGSREYSMTLNPEELGRITVKLTKAADGSVSVTIAAENARTQRILEQNSAEMQNNLRGSGVKLESWQTVNEAQQETYAQDYRGSSRNPYYRGENHGDDRDETTEDRSFAELIASM